MSYTDPSYLDKFRANQNFGRFGSREKIIQCKCALCGGFGSQWESMSGYDPRNTLARHASSAHTVPQFLQVIQSWFDWQASALLTMARRLSQ